MHIITHNSQYAVGIHEYTCTHMHTHAHKPYQTCYVLQLLVSNCEAANQEKPDRGADAMLCKEETFQFVGASSITQWYGMSVLSSNTNAKDSPTFRGCERACISEHYMGVFSQKGMRITLNTTWRGFCVENTGMSRKAGFFGSLQQLWPLRVALAATVLLCGLNAMS
jgi:hypothetical protein